MQIHVKCCTPVFVGAKSQSGFTYLTVLFIIAFMGLGLALAGQVWSTARQREKEAELLFIGHQFRNAIKLYYAATPGAIKQYPRNLTDLLQDPRQPQAQRYLRKIYIDPFTNKPDWGLVRSPDNGIMGVYSPSEETPIKTANFKISDANFEGKTKYSDWQFIYTPDTANAAPPVPGGGNSAPVPPFPLLPGP